MTHGVTQRVSTQVLINNAGVYGRRLSFSDFEPDDFLTTFNTNAVRPGKVRTP